MRVWAGVAVAVGLMGFAAHAAPGDSAADAPFNLDPANAPPAVGGDIEAGRRYAWRGDLACSTNIVKATFRIDKMHTDPKWAPAMRIMLKQWHTEDKPETLDAHAESISLSLLRFAPERPIELVLERADTRKTQEQIAYSVPADVLGKVMPVAIAWSADGVYTVTVSGRLLKTIRMDRPPLSVAFVLSGVQGEIGAILVGHSGPAAPCAAPAKPAP